MPPALQNTSEHTTSDQLEDPAIDPWDTFETAVAKLLSIGWLTTESVETTASEIRYLKPSD